MGHFHILANDIYRAVDSLPKTVDFTRLAKQPKNLALYGVALLAEGSQEKAREIFESASSGRDPERHYKADDKLALALCDLGARRTELGVSTIRTLSIEYRQMRGLLLETSALLSVMQTCGIDGCDQCITLIDSAVDIGSS